MPTATPKTLRQLSSNPGIRAAYRRKLETLIREMHADVSKAILEEFDAASWRMARDGAWRSPSERLADRLEQVMRSWERRFRFFARNTTKGFLRQIWDRVRVGRKNELARLGIVVKVNPSRFTSELFQALLKENISLIQSIPTTYYARIEQDVQRAISAGGDRAGLIKSLRRNYGFTENRSVLPARGARPIPPYI